MTEDDLLRALPLADRLRVAAVDLAVTRAPAALVEAVWRASEELAALAMTSSRSASPGLQERVDRPTGSATPGGRVLHPPRLTSLSHADAPRHGCDTTRSSPARSCRPLAEDGDYLIELPEAELGLLPGAGGTQRLPRTIGTPAALMHILMGDPLTPREAERKGLVHETVSGKALDRAMEIARRLSSFTPESLAYIKRLVRNATETPLAQGLALERNLFLKYASPNLHSRACVPMKRRTSPRRRALSWSKQTRLMCNRVVPGRDIASRTRCREETSHVLQHIDLADPQSSRRLR
jgi:hypothetical protein